MNLRRSHLAVFLLTSSFSLIGGLALKSFAEKKKTSTNPLFVPFLNVKAVPNPSQVVTTWEWYFLNQVSSSLIKWSSQLGAFEGYLAEKWEIRDNQIEFTLKKNLKFSNGKSLTAMDVSTTLKQAVIKKTNTHFKPWEILIGCSDIQRFDEDCKGIKVLSETKIRFELAYPSESFFLYLASPEGAIWESSEIAKDEFAPSAFSGPYLVNFDDSGQIRLKSNKNWVFDDRYPERFPEIRTITESDKAMYDSIKNGQLSVVLDLKRPFREVEFNTEIYSRRMTGFNTLYYLFRVSGSHGKISRDYLKNLWQKEFPSDLEPASTFLPFDGLAGVSKEEILDKLPMRTDDKPIRVGYVKDYFSDEFVNFLFRDSSLIKQISLDSSSYNEAFDINYKKNDLDFLLVPYVASERYPSVQINFIVEGREIPFDTNRLDHPDSKGEKKEVMSRIQDWMITEQLVIPLVFGRAQLLYKNGLDVSTQDLVDSEIQLWRLKGI